MIHSLILFFLLSLAHCLDGVIWRSIFLGNAMKWQWEWISNEKRKMWKYISIRDKEFFSSLKSIQDVVWEIGIQNWNQTHTFVYGCNKVWVIRKLIDKRREDFYLHLLLLFIHLDGLQIWFPWVLRRHVWLSAAGESVSRRLATTSRNTQAGGGGVSTDSCGVNLICSYASVGHCLMFHHPFCHFVLNGWFRVTLICKFWFSFCFLCEIKVKFAYAAAFCK